MTAWWMVIIAAFTDKLLFIHKLFNDALSTSRMCSVEWGERMIMYDYVWFQVVITGEDGTTIVFTWNYWRKSQKISEDHGLFYGKTIRSLHPDHGSNWVYQNTSQMCCRLADLLCSEIYHRYCFKCWNIRLVLTSETSVGLITPGVLLDSSQALCTTWFDSRLFWPRVLAAFLSISKQITGYYFQQNTTSVVQIHIYRSWSSSC
jgi:hypothetical protein